MLRKWGLRRKQAARTTVKNQNIHAKSYDQYVHEYIIDMQLYCDIKDAYWEMGQAAATSQDADHSSMQTRQKQSTGFGDFASVSESSSQH